MESGDAFSIFLQNGAVFAKVEESRSHAGFIIANTTMHFRCGFP
jgi:hypothetical protein